MKFICVCILCAAFVYALIAAHYLSFDKEERYKELESLSRSVKDVRLSDSFESAEYRGFVYGK